MTAKALRINAISRDSANGGSDELTFERGVNAIVADLNAGKTTWLQMLDFALGDGGEVEKAFDESLAQKYDRISVSLNAGGKDHVVERRWKEARAKRQIFVNGESLDAKEFSEFLLGALGIPILKVSVGNPYADRAWRELSWRELFRNMYKQERFWSDFAQGQPESVRAACILHFLNAAGALYPKESADLVAKRRERDKLEAQKDLFVKVMQDLVLDVVRQPEMTVSVTPESIGVTRQRLNARQSIISAERIKVLAVFDQQVTQVAPQVEGIKQRVEALHAALGTLENERNQLVRRRAELNDYLGTLDAELSRLGRAKVATSVLADLKVTHCPSCDQEIPPNRFDLQHCAVCGQLHSQPRGDSGGALRRIEFEESQVSEERGEMVDLIATLVQELKALDRRIAEVREDIAAERRTLQAAQSYSVRGMPPEVALLDREAGAIASDLRQLDRVAHALSTRDEMNDQATKLDAAIVALDAEIKRLTPTVNFGQLGDLIADRMNHYLNLVNTDELSRYKAGQVSVRLRKDTFELLLGGQPWTVKAGGTNNYIIQIAFQYALLSLTGQEPFNYPGLLIMDFPPHFARKDELGSSENYLLRPFVELCNSPSALNAQVIIAGRAFKDLNGARIISL